ncbi:MAG: heparinase II/III family protein, partial [Chloroflexota bacterium]
MSKSLRQVGLAQAVWYALYKIGLKTGHYKRVENRVPKTGHLLSSTLLSLPNRAELAQVLGDDGQRALLAEADEIVAGKFRRFGGEPVEIELAFAQPLRHWTDYETNPQLLSTLHSPLPDIKFTWEPARFGWAYPLGRAYHLTGNETYAETFWRNFETFTEANPPYLGPHWMNGQEVALRLMALVWAGQVFAPYGETAAGSSGERRARLAQSVAQHAARIPPTLVYARAQDNNHLVTEAAALYTAGLALGHAKWRALGWRHLNRALQRQISDYGEYIQHSVNYHRVMLQAALWVDAIKDTDWPRLTFRSLGRATHWLFSLLDPAS